MILTLINDINPSGVKISREHSINITDAYALAPYIAWKSAANILSKWRNIQTYLYVSSN